MHHPSMGNADDPNPQDPGQQYPPGASEEQVQEVIRQIVEATELCGLYSEPMFQIEFTHDHSLSGECEQDHVVVHMFFRIGDVAFTKRVQDPEQDNFDDSARKMDTDLTRDKVEDIKRRFGRAPEDPA